jgi:hypothetical protein
MTMLSPASVPVYMLRGAMGALGARGMYSATKKQ